MAKCLDPSGEKASQDHLNLANQAYDDRAFEVALREFALAYENCRSAMAFYGTANSEEQLGRETEAARDFDRFLREASDAEEELRDRAEGKLRDLAARLTRVDLTGAVEGTAVFIDRVALIGWAQGTPIYLLPGTHTLRIAGGTASGFERALTGTMGSRLRLEVPLAGAEPTAQPTPPPAASHHRWWLWTGIAAVLVAGAVAGYVVTRPDRPACPTLCP